jgi:hypothetical protein
MEQIIRAYARLTSLKDNLQSVYSINEKYIKEYHEIIQIIEEALNISLKEFKIPENEIKHELRSSWPSIPSLGRKAGATYSKDRYCERALFMSKLDALLSYFKIKYLSSEKTEIGFQPSEE